VLSSSEDVGGGGEGGVWSSTSCAGPAIVAAIVSLWDVVGGRGSRRVVKKSLWFPSGEDK